MLSAVGKLQSMIMGNWNTQIVGTFAQLKLADVIGSAALSVSEINNKMTPPCNQEYLERYLRSAEVLNLVKANEVAPLKYQLTDLGMLLKENGPFWFRAVFVVHEFPQKCWMNLSQAIQKGQPGFSIAFGKNWEYWNETQERAEFFSSYMTNHTKTIASEQNWKAHQFLFTNVNTLVDVGGSEGILLCSILKLNPHLKGVIFDLEKLESKAVNYIQAQNLSDRACFQKGDFFNPETIISADCYMMKSVLHEGTDEECIQILRNIAKVAPQGSKFYNVDLILDMRNQQSILLDIHMMMVTGGRERSLHSFIDIFDQSGWKFTETRKVGNTPFNIICATRV